MSDPSRARTHSRSRSSSTIPTAIASLAAASSGPSFSRIPAWDFTTSASAQNVIPSPYGRHRPWRHETRSGRSSMNVRNSRVSRDLPTPGSPDSVTSCGVRSRTTRSNEPCSSDSSPARPINGVDVPGSMSTPNRLRAAIARQMGIGSSLPFTDIGGQVLVVDDLTRRPVGELPHDHAADRCRALEPGGDVHDVTGDEALAGLGPRAQRHDGLAGVDRAPHREIELRTGLVQLLDRLQDPQRRPDRAFGVVLVRDRCAEDGHHRVPDELLDGAAEPLDLPLQQVVIHTEGRADILRVGVIGSGGEPHEIDEQDGHDLALLARG